MKKYFYIFFIVFFFSFIHIPAEEKKALSAQDVKQVMREILKQNGNENNLTEKIIQNSFKIYINQFDPYRIYLLESEVSPYLDPSKEKIAEVMRGWQNNEFKAYERLNRVIEQSIARAERERKSFAFNNFEEPVVSTGKESEFAKTLTDLKTRQKNYFLQFLHDQEQKFGKDPSPMKKREIAEKYEQSMTAHEKEYLASESSIPLQDRKSLFHMHVLKGLTKGLDAHTSYLDNKEAFEMKLRLEKSMDGIGILVGKKDNDYIVSKILENSPALENGKVKENDRILKINGEPLNKKDISEVIDLLRGKAGTEVTLTIQREGKSPENIRLTRKTILINEGRVTYRYIPFEGGVIGVIKLKSFYQNDSGVSAEEDIRRAIAELSTKGRLKGLVLDLRENSGGFLNQAVKVAGLFITNGVVVVSKYSNGEERFYRDMDGKVSYDGPLVILTSKITASAAEIVAQALQDYGVALVVGDDHTYGKGTIQSQTVTEGEASSYFKVTVGKYYTASGKTPQESGVKADIVVPSILNGEQIGEEYLDSHLTNDHIDPAFQDTLQDIDSAIRPWYVRYYIPTLQKRSFQWKDVVGKLRENSRERLKKGDYSNKIQSENFGYDMKGDLQLLESVNIVKDMVNHEAKKEGRGLTTQSSHP